MDYSLYFFVDPGSYRYKLSFSIRDSTKDYINVTCWGSQDYIGNLTSSFKIYDISKVYMYTIYTCTCTCIR